MRNLTISLVAILCTSCTLLPVDIPEAPSEQSQAVVFDIDGTLTPEPMAIFTVREGAVNAARFYADKGYKIIYLSARVRPLQSSIPSWLETNNFPAGTIHVPQTLSFGYQHTVFKKGIVNAYRRKGWKLLAAYGDSSTDFDAYSKAGFKKERIFALRRVGKPTCQPGVWAKCLDSWAEHMSDITQMIR